MTDDELMLPQGRTVGFADHGVPGDVAVVWCHGGPGSRLAPAHLGPQARAAGVRLIGIDRPGYGRSTPLPGRTIADWVPDALAVADHLGIERFVTVGVSTGGAFALAVAALAPARVLGVVTCGALTDMAAGDPYRSTMSSAHAQAVWDAPDRASAIVASARAHGEHGEELRQITSVLPPSDLARFADPRQLAAMTADLSAAFAFGNVGLADDRIADRDGWTTFDVQSIVCPVVVLHGRLDPLVAVAHAEHTAAIVPTARLSLLEEHGHFSILDLVVPEIVAMVPR
jgi:pimeloyl-ACP methyl ester carboxylesterase